MTYSIYVVKKLVDLKPDDGPLCPFPSGGYCDVPNKKVSCLNCDISRKDYENEEKNKWY